MGVIRAQAVGRGRRVGMADVRGGWEEPGHKEVRPLLNRGNIVFNSPGTTPAKSAADIEQALSKRLGLSARVMVLSAAELSGTVEENPLGKVANNPSRLLVTFLMNPADRKLLMPLAKRRWKPEA